MRGEIQMQEKMRVKFYNDSITIFSLQRPHKKGEKVFQILRAFVLPLPPSPLPTDNDTAPVKKKKISPGNTSYAQQKMHFCTHTAHNSLMGSRKHAFEK